MHRGLNSDAIIFMHIIMRNVPMGSALSHSFDFLKRLFSADIIIIAFWRGAFKNHLAVSYFVFG